MKILVFGASGKTGLHLVEQALSRNHEITAFARNPQLFPLHHRNLKFCKGNVTDCLAVLNSIEGHDAVLCALGAKSPFRNDPSLIEGIKNIVQAMEVSGVTRLIYLSFLGVHENRKELGFVVNSILSRLLKKVIQDHEEKENIIANSKLDWTIVRPPRLTNAPPRGSCRHGERILPRTCILKISRADLAKFILRQLLTDEYIHKKPRVMY